MRRPCIPLFVPGHGGEFVLGFMRPTSMVEYQKTSQARLDNVASLSLDLFTRGKPVVCQCREGKDRSVFMAAMYSWFEQLILNPERKPTVEEFAEFTHRVRCNSTLQTSLSALPELLLGSVCDDARVVDYLKGLGFSGEDKDLADFIGSNSEKLTRGVFCDNNPVFAIGMEVLHKNFSAKLAAHKASDNDKVTPVLAQLAERDALSVDESVPTGSSVGSKDAAGVRPIIMIDHGGVLDYETRAHNPAALRPQLAELYSSAAQVDQILANKTIRSTDFLMPLYKDPNDQGDALDTNNVNVLPDGAATIRLLNKLVAEHNAILVFHSKNKEAAQMHIVNALAAAVKKHNADHQDNLAMPPFSAMVVADSEVYPDVTPDKPTIDAGKAHGIPVVGFAEFDGDEGKHAVRQALEVRFKVKPEERCFHYVLDDGGSNHRKAVAEGYTSHRINDTGVCQCSCRFFLVFLRRLLHIT